MFKASDLTTFKKRSKSRYMQGHFSPLHPQKYVGDRRAIIYRSSWELKFMTWADTNPGVVKWSSEETIIPYVSPVDKKYHRYFVDFKIIVNTSKGQKTILIEVKPDKQTRPPAIKQKVTKSYVKEVVTYAINDAKFTAAREFCEKRDWEFQIVNEYDLKIV